MADVHVKGLAELQKFLNTLPAKIEANIVRNALRAGMKVVETQAKADAPIDTGQLFAAMGISTRLRGGRGIASLRVRGFDGYKAMWSEFGVRPHLIKVQEEEKPINLRLTAKRGHIVRASMSTVNRNVLVIGNKFVGPTVSHPGISEKPFMRPALDKQKTAALIAIGNYIKKRLATKHGINTSHVMIEGDE